MSTTIEAPVVELEGLGEPSQVAQRIEKGVEHIGADKVLGEIRKSCLIVYVTVRAWRGQYQMHNAQVVLDGKQVSEDLTTKPSSKLVPKKWHDDLQKFESRTRKLVRQMAVPFKDGVYVVPKSRAKDLVDAVKAVREEYVAKVAEFQSEWPDIVAALEERFTVEHGEDQWLALSKVLPDARRLGKLFDIEVGLWPVASGGGLPVECLEDLQSLCSMYDDLKNLADDAHDDLNDPQRLLLETLLLRLSWAQDKVRSGVGKLIEENAEDYLAEAQRATNRMVAQAVEAMVTEPVREFAEAVDTMIRVSDDGRAKQATLDAVRRAHQKLQDFSFLLPAELLQRLRDVELRLGSADARSVNIASRSVTGSKLREALQQIREDLATDAAQLSAFGQFARNLDI